MFVILLYHTLILCSGDNIVILLNPNDNNVPLLLIAYITQRGVCKQWTGLLEWWNTGMVDWIVFHFCFYIYHVVASLLCLHLPKLLALLHIIQ